MIFRNWVLQNFPFLEDDFDALTDYELFCKMVEYMKKSLDKVLEFQDELNEFRAELDSYKNYFDNLDVQEEVDNKLDEMAESGELTDIIAQYLQLAGVLAYDTTNDLSEATNIVNGSICRTLGDATYNDGKGGYYKVRTVTVDDTIDGFNIVALDVSNTLIAERMPNYYINELQSDINDLEEQINKNHVLIIGDSWSIPQEGVTKWYQFLASATGYVIDNFAVTGSGFYHCDIANTTFSEQLDNASLTVDPDTLKYIIVYGGVNDYRNGVSEANFAGGLNGVRIKAKQYFPDAELILLPLNIGYSNNAIYNGFSKYRTNVIHDSLVYTAGFCQTVSYWLMPYGSGIWTETEGEKLHPTENGHKIICSYILSILNGTYDGVHNEVYYGNAGSPNDNNVRISFNNGLLNVCGLTNTITGTSGTINISGGLNTYLFGTFPSSFFGTGTAIDGSTCTPFFVYIGQDGNLSVEGRTDLTGKACVINSTWNS